MQDDYFLKIKGITLKKSNQIIFENFSWFIKNNENWLISGNNGSGKTLLAEVIKGISPIIDGQINFYFSKDNLSVYENRKLIQFVTFKSISSVLNFNSFYYQQRYNSTESDDYITVEDFLGKSHSLQSDNKQIFEISGLEPLLKYQLIKLSNGQLRKLFLAKALLAYPKLLILDNPYTGLDTKSRKELNKLLDILYSKYKIRLIIIDQNYDLPECITHELKLEKIDQINKIKYQKEINKDYLPKENFLSKEKTDKLDKVIEKIASFKTSIIPNYKTIIGFEDVSIKYETKDILNNLTWIVKQGDKWSITGNNGSGKTTVLSLIYGDNPQAYKNKILLFDKKRGSGESIWDIKKNIGFTSPELHINFDYSLTNYQVVSTGFFDSFFVKRKISGDEKEIINLYFKYFEMDGLLNKPFSDISTGEQKVILFIRAIIKRPALILLDEPFQVFDAINLEKAKYLLYKILKEQDTLILIIHFKNEIPEFINNNLHLEEL